MKKYINISPERAREILAQREKLKNPIELDSLFSPDFPQQRNFVLDTSKLKCLFATRRAAKSYTAGLYAVYEALSMPNCNVLLVGLTRTSVKGIFWKDILRVIDRKHKLNCKFNKAELSMTFPNGSIIQMTGIDADEDDMNKWLGRKYRLVCIDEASMYTVNLKHFVYDILKPAMADLRGTIALFGTSSNFTRGLFYDITTGTEAGWSVHTHSAFDNPFVAKEWAEEIKDIKELRPLYMETPQYQQWYLNKWVVETDKLVYKYNSDRNLYRELSKGLNPTGWRYVLGVDTGWEDDNAFVLTGYHENDPHLYVIKTFNKKHMYFDHDDPNLSVIKKIQEFMNDTQYPVSKVIIDGANKQGIETMKVRSSIPFEYADKKAKVDFIEMLNGDLIQGKIKIHYNNQVLIDELMSLVWKTDGVDKIQLPKKEHPALPNHLCDAFLYAWRMGYHYHAEPAAKTIVVGSKEWYSAQADDIWEREAEVLKKQQNKYFPDDDGGWSNL